MGRGPEVAPDTGLPANATQHAAVTMGLSRKKLGIRRNRLTAKAPPGAAKGTVGHKKHKRHRISPGLQGRTAESSTPLVRFVPLVATSGLGGVSAVQEFPTPANRLRPGGTCGKGNTTRSGTTPPPCTSPFQRSAVRDSVSVSGNRRVGESDPRASEGDHGY